MTRKTPRPYHHGDLRRALLEAAEGLLGGEGVEGLSLRSIARRAGVSHAAPYHHFADVEDILASVAANGFLRLRARMLEEAAPRDDSALGRLQKAGIAYVKFAAENPDLYRLMFSGKLRRSSNPDLAEASNGAYAALGELLTHLDKEASKSPRPGGDPTAHAAWATVHGLAMLIIDGRLDVDPGDPDAVAQAAREVTAVLGRGLRR